MQRNTASAFVRDQFTWLSYAMLAYYGYYQASLGPLMPFLRVELGLSYTAAGFHFSAFALGMILAGMAGNRLAGRWGRYRIFWSGAIGMAVGVGVMMLGQRISLTVAAAFIMGMLGTLMLVMIQAALSDRHGRRRTVALTEANVAASLSGTLVPLFIGTFQRLGWGWRSALIIPMLALVVIGLRNRALSIPDQRENLYHANRDNPLPPRFWAYWMTVLVTVAIEWCLIFWGADYLENVVGLVKTDAATTMSVFFLAMVLGRVSGSRFTRRVPGEKLLVAALLATITGFLFFWQADLAIINIAGLFLAGLGVANLYPLIVSLAVGVDPTQANLASARISLGAGLAIFSAPLILGWIADGHGIRTAYGIVPWLFLIAILMTLYANYRVTEPISD